MLHYGGSAVEFGVTIMIRIGQPRLNRNPVLRIDRISSSSGDSSIRTLAFPYPNFYLLKKGIRSKTRK